MNGSRRTLTILGGAALLAIAVYVLFRGKPVGAARVPAASAEASTARTSPPPPSRAQRDAVSEARARRARDAMRDQILEALRKREAASPTKPAATAQATAASAPAPAGEEPPHGHYDPQYIRASFRQDMFPLLRSCYGDALLRQPKLAGKLVLKFAIVGDPSVGGVVEDADFADASDIQDDEMRTCVRESLMTLTLDKPPEGGGKVTVTYPIAFAPDDDGEGDGGAERRYLRSTSRPLSTSRFDTVSATRFASGTPRGITIPTAPPVRVNDQASTDPSSSQRESLPLPSAGIDPSSSRRGTSSTAIRSAEASSIDSPSGAAEMSSHSAALLPSRSQTGGAPPPQQHHARRVRVDHLARLRPVGDRRRPGASRSRARGAWARRGPPSGGSTGAWGVGPLAAPPWKGSSIRAIAPDPKASKRPAASPSRAALGRTSTT